MEKKSTKLIKENQENKGWDLQQQSIDQAIFVLLGGAHKLLQISPEMSYKYDPHKTYKKWKKKKKIVIDTFHNWYYSYSYSFYSWASLDAPGQIGWYQNQLIVLKPKLLYSYAGLSVCVCLYTRKNLKMYFMYFTTPHSSETWRSLNPFRQKFSKSKHGTLALCLFFISSIFCKNIA